MKSSPAPAPIRCGGLVRTEARDASHRGARTFVLSFVDLRFDDGHIERWLGPGSVGVEQADYCGLPVEVVVEWNHALDVPFDDIAPEPPVD